MTWRPVHTAQLPHQNSIPYCLLEVTGGLCYRLHSAQALLREVCVDWTQNRASTKNLVVNDCMRASHALTLHNLLGVAIRLLAHL